MVTLGSVLGRGRHAAMWRMTETVQIGLFKDGTDPVTLEATRVIATERYAGKGRVKFPTLTVSDVTQAATDAVSQDITVSIPSGSPVCFQGDEVVVTASSSDGTLVGRRFKVIGAAQAGQTTAHRYPVIQLS